MILLSILYTAVYTAMYNESRLSAFNLVFMSTFGF